MSKKEQPQCCKNGIIKKDLLLLIDFLKDSSVVAYYLKGEDLKRRSDLFRSMLDKVSKRIDFWGKIDGISFEKRLSIKQNFFSTLT